MKNHQTIIPQDDHDDGDERWMIPYDPQSPSLEDRATWERTLQETQELARRAEGGAVSQMRLGNFFVRQLLFLFRHDDPKVANAHSAVEDLPQHPPTLDDIESALRHLFDVHALSENPLARALSLSRHQRGNDPKALAPGYALQRALNEALDHFTAPAPRSIHDESLRVHHYLHLRYREGMSPRELARALGYEERHVRRLRQDLFRRFGEVLLALNSRR